MVAGYLRPEALPCGHVVVLAVTSDEVARLLALPSRAQETDSLALAPPLVVFSAPAREKAEVVSAATASAAEEA